MRAYAFTPPPVREPERPVEHESPSARACTALRVRAGLAQDRRCVLGSSHHARQDAPARPFGRARSPGGPGRVRRNGRERAWPAFLLALALCGCASGPLRQARARLAASDLPGAVAAAGADRAALREVSLAILSDAMREPAHRAAAARGLRAGGSLSRSALERILSWEDGPASALAAAALLALGHQGALAVLEARLAHPEGEARAAAVSALAPSNGDRSFHEGWLRDTDDRVRLAEVTALGGLRAELAVPLLAEAARRDPAPPVRAAALRALGARVPGDDLLEVARGGLRDESLPVRLAAVAALGRAEPRPAAAALLAPLLASDEPVLAVRAAAVLASFGDERGRARLGLALTAPGVSVASAAAIAAGQLDGAMDEELVAALARPEPQVRLHVAAALLGGPARDRARRALEGLLERPGWLGLQGALALSRERPEAARARLGRALESEDVAERVHAAGAAARFDDGLEPVRAALADELEAVRVAAASSVLGILARQVSSTVRQAPARPRS